jgi:dihydrofolate synthase/folylpolyglutamate synthase
MKPGLERIAVILERLGNPQSQLQVVHIAGTNGKGSTGAFLSAIMTAAGCRPAFFSSPHLSVFAERFRINDVDVAEDILTEAAGKVLAVAPAEATFFELVTAIAYYCFAREKAGLAIMEAGMGGRWDATNVAEGLLTIVTPIALDHCEYLGDTLAAIAAEKAGIIKQGRPVVISRQATEALAPLLAAAGRKASPVFRFGVDFAARQTSGGLDCRAGDWELNGLKPALRGRFQAGNAAAAVMAARLLATAGFTVTPESVFKGVSAARWPGRLELFPGSPPVLLDGAHNPAGALALRESLADFPRRRLLLLAGVLADKSWQETLLTLLPLAAVVVAVQPSLERALPAEELAGFCSMHGCEAFAAGDVAAGLAHVTGQAGADDLVLVTGSLFTVGEARALLSGLPFMPISG